MTECTGQKLNEHQESPLMIASLLHAVLRKQCGHLLGSQTLVVLEPLGALGKYRDPSAALLQ